MFLTVHQQTAAPLRSGLLKDHTRFPGPLNPLITLPVSGEPPGQRDALTN